MPNPLIRDPVTQLAAEFGAGFIAPLGYIDGLQMVWNSATSVGVSTGACYIPSLGYALPFTSALTLSGLSLTASTWYHLYGYSNSGTPAIELVTTAPATAYNGTARAKTGDTTRRYLGSLYSNSSSQIAQFTVVGNKFVYTNPNGNMVISNGTSITSTAVSCSTYAPITATAGNFRFQNNTSTTSANFGYLASGGQTASSSNVVLAVGSALAYSLSGYGDVAFDSSQNVAYSASSSSASLYLFVLGYYYGR